MSVRTHHNRFELILISNTVSCLILLFQIFFIFLRVEAAEFKLPEKSNSVIQLSKNASSLDKGKPSNTSIQSSSWVNAPEFVPRETKEKLKFVNLNSNKSEEDKKIISATEAGGIHLIF